MIKTVLRFFLMAGIAAAAAALIYQVSPVQLPVVAYKALLVTTGANVGYLVDRTLFPYGRPHTFASDDQRYLFAFAMMRRAIIVAAVVIGFAVAL